MVFGEGLWGLGTSFSERQLEDDNDLGRKVVEVSGFRHGEDDDGNDVISPGLAGGLKIGDRVIRVDGYELVDGLKEFKLEVLEDRFLAEVELTIERTLKKGMRKPRRKRKSMTGKQLPQISHERFHGLDGWEPEICLLELDGGHPDDPVGINISEIYGSGNEGYGVDKAYLTVNAVRQDSRGQKCGILAHDTVVAVDRQLVFSTTQFKAAVRKSHPRPPSLRTEWSKAWPGRRASNSFACRSGSIRALLVDLGFGARLRT